MVVEFIQRANEINLENADTVKSFEIRYSGSFVGEVIGNAKVRLTRNKIFIDYIIDIYIKIYSIHLFQIDILCKDIIFKITTSIS